MRVSSYQRLNEAERRAQDTLRKWYDYLAKKTHGPIEADRFFPVDVEAIATDICGLQVLTEPFIFADTVDSYYDSKRQAIVISGTIQSEERRRFSLAHEIGHYVLGHTGKVFRGATRSVRYLHAVPDPRAEAEARLFAVTLLMPERAVRREFSKRFDSVPTSAAASGARAEVVAKVLAGEQTRDLRSLRQYFGVSTEAMARRLVALAAC